MGMPGKSRLRLRKGFGLPESLVVLVLVGILVRIAVVKTSQIMRHERVNRAASVVVQDLENGFAMAGRQRAPVRLTFNPTAKTYEFADRSSGTVYMKRLMSNGTEFQLSSLASTATSVDILPNGIGSTSFTVTVALGDYSRQVTASTAGFVRMTRP
jgi:prepilin-type N-terminal cleavage/methylation domain-containing protein